MKRIICVTSIFMFFLSEIATADFGFHHIFEQINNGFNLGFTAMNFNYREDVRDVDPNAPGDVKNTGMAYGIAVGVRNVFLERLYTDLSGEYAIGKIRYDGFKHYTYVPVSNRATNDFVNLDAKLGVILLDHEYFQLIPYGGLGFRYWKLDTGDDYRYYNFKAVVGSKINCTPIDNLVLSPYFNFGTTLGAHAKSKVYDINQAYQGKANLSLGNKAIQELGLEINYRLESEIFLVGTVSYTHFGFGRSSQQTVGSIGVTEPNSKTNEVRFGIGIKYSFM